MAVLIWDAPKDRYYEFGVSKGVHYLKGEQGAYDQAEAWNGLISVTESPSGAENTKLWADGIEYANLRAAEQYAASIEAYTYPNQFGVCDGSAELVEGVSIGQQERKEFGLCYRTEVGSAEKGMTAGYTLHLAYGLTASPSEKAHNTVNDSPEADTFSWDVEGSPVPVAGYKPTASLTIDSRKFTAEQMKAIEDVLYGGTDTEPRLPLPDEVKTLMAAQTLQMKAKAATENKNS